MQVTLIGKNVYINCDSTHEMEMKLRNRSDVESSHVYVANKESMLVGSGLSG